MFAEAGNTYCQGIGCWNILLMFTILIQTIKMPV